MNRAAFYAVLRRRDSGVFGTSLSQGQVDGIEAILDAGAHLPLSHLAYTLATTYGETGGRMQPIVENLNYTSARRLMQVWPKRFPTEASAAPYVRNPEALANLVYGGILGNTQTGDGWRFRGHGLVQITGRTNFAKVRDLTGVDVVTRPELALQIDVAAKALIAGIEHGIYTGKKASDYLPGDYVNARRIINGTFEASKYAGYALAFDAALVAGGYAQPQAAPVPPPPRPAPQAPAPKTGVVAAILAALTRILGGRK